MATANQRVGPIYEVAIAGIGLMLADNPSRPVRRQTGALDTQPPGSDDPLSERIGRYDFIAQTDWSGGEGQEMADRPASDVTRYDVSDGVDPFDTPGQLTCLPAPTNIQATANDLTTNTSNVFSPNPGLIGARPHVLRADRRVATDRPGRHGVRDGPGRRHQWSRVRRRALVRDR